MKNGVVFSTLSVSPRQTEYPKDVSICKACGALLIRT